MIPNLDFIRPCDIDETLSLLADYRGNARLIAGGTDIIPGFHQSAPRFKDIKFLIDIHDLKELQGISRENDLVIIGAGSTFSEITGHPLIRDLFPVLAKAAGAVGSVQIRNRASIAGNFVNNAPCADSVPPLLVYDAMIRVQSPRGKREIPLEDFSLSPYKTQLQQDEIVTQVVLPVPGKDYRGEFYKLGRRRGAAISRISLALLVDIRESVIHDLRVASGAVTPIAKRFKRLEESARGKTADAELFERLAGDLAQEILEITGLRWSTDYKLPVVRQVFYQLLESKCNG